MATINEFREKLVSYAERVQRIRDHIKNEEATKVALVLPFIALLGYDDRDPTEVAAEHAADFSEKYRNRVDYAILKDLIPVIAIECKNMGNGRRDDRGQLKSYFNAAKTVKLGILTDGILYEFFVDSEQPNMMDDDPFLVIDFDKISKAQISDTEIEGLYALSKQRFDPETISENARRSLTHKAFYDYLSAQFSDPSIDFTRFLLKENDIKHVRANAMDGYKAIAKAAFNDVFTSNVLKRLDIPAPALKPAARAENTPDTVPAAPVAPQPQIVTTEAELAAFESVRRLLAFLSSGNRVLFEAVSDIRFRDYQGKMVVFYKQERKGRLIDIFEGRDSAIRYSLIDGGDIAAVSELSELGARLLALFERRIADF
ncbi:type I restriction endonuclease [Bosea sp. TWI1241]|uniref:type I restriction endonuclease n=1 Tax=Bosea sp. TWI1241 TaxID=3148904 RepID=UPI003207A7FE